MRRRRRRWIIVLLVFGAAFGIWWVIAAPPDYLVAAEPYRLGPVPAAVLAVRANDDYLAQSVDRSAIELPGHDEIVLQERLGRAFVSARDGWIWQVDLASGHAEHLVQAPMSPTGARLVPADDDKILFCSSRLDANVYSETVQPGIYELTISTRSVSPVALRVPLPPPIRAPKPGNSGSLYSPSETPPVAFRDMNDQNSRPIAFCNDLDISRDGRRIYMSEPFDHPGASSGTGAVPEAITLARHGRLWQFDREHQTARLVAQDYCFIDGVLLEYAGSDLEQSVLVTETAKYRIDRFWLNGPRAGSDQILWEFLPGLPDGLDRDEQGRVHVALIKERSGLASIMHEHPWLKRFLLRLPQRLLPIAKTTGVLVLSPDASTPLFHTMHDGSKVRDISAVVPGKDRIYLASFDRENHGLCSIPYPPQLGAAASSAR